MRVRVHRSRRAAPRGGNAPASVRQVLSSPGTEHVPGGAAGHRLDGVRIHADQAARASADEVGAVAYTVGQHVVFGTAMPAPGSAAGRRILDHEIAHTRQQPRFDSPPASIPLGAQDAVQEQHPGVPDAAPVLRRITYDRTCSNLRGACPPDSPEAQASEEAWNRMRATAVGQWLLQQLERIPSLASATIHVRFATNVTMREPGVQGIFLQTSDGYDVIVDILAHGARGTATAAQPNTPLPAPTGPAYGAGNRTVETYVVEQPSMLAETLFHELLHVWFENTIGTRSAAHPDGPQYGTTGHGNAAQGEIDPRFFRRLVQFSEQIYRVETDPARIRAAAARNQPAQPAPPPQDNPPLRTEPRTRREPGERAPVSFTAAVLVGAGSAPPEPAAPGMRPGASRPDFALQGSVGVLFGRAYQLGIVGTALWMPNAGLFAPGGGIHFRAAQVGPQGTQVDNPFVFDMEAGVAYMIGRSNPLLINVGIGVGQEYGSRTSLRPFWQVGGALLLNPPASGENPTVGGYGGVTAGIRY